jgi:HD-like signal output (HDOD) protein
VGISALSIFPSQKEQGFDYGRFWQQSILAGVSAGLIASRIPGDQPADVFSAALLQNIGILFLVRYRPLEYGTALGMAKGQNLPLAAAERESWGGGPCPTWRTDMSQMANASVDGRSHSPPPFCRIA